MNASGVHKTVTDKSGTGNTLVVTYVLFRDESGVSRRGTSLLIMDVFYVIESGTA